ncbi:hypothetical protein GCM10010278_83890 [Streptomyces melanogenes]|nr:hypothetical protein GCM10010278_83890 [Streptomyces melanogenes]
MPSAYCAATVTDHTPLARCALRSAVTDAGAGCAAGVSGTSTPGAIDCASRACALDGSPAVLRNHEPTNNCAKPAGSATAAAVVLRNGAGPAGVAAFTAGALEATATARATGPEAMTPHRATREKRTRRRIASSRAPPAIGAAAAPGEACMPEDMVELPGQKS